MSCYHPLKAFPIGTTKNGKAKYIITSYDVDHVEEDKNGNWHKCYDNFIAACRSFVKNFIEVPCGQCVGCRLDRSKEWANRCMMELQYHEESWFVTLTYDDEHLPTSKSYDTDTGEQRELPTLVKKDWQDFMKRLRKNYKGDNKLRFFMCGEYGSQTHRPHYHAIIFGLHLDDLEVYSKSEQGYTYYNSKFLTDCWQNKGYVVAGAVSWDTCAYTARYIMKKLNGEAAQIYTDLNIQPEFTLMSRRPGIAAQYYIDHPGVMEYDRMSISTDDGGKTFKPPRYFEKLFDIDNPQDVVPYYSKLYSDKTRIAEAIRRAKLSKTSLDYQEYLLTEEANKKAQIKSLKRKGVM